jgi:hypothetical protein
MKRIAGSLGAAATLVALVGATLAWPSLASVTPAVGYTNWNDFNADGYQDLAIGAPFDDVAQSGTSIHGAGVVNVIYGSAHGLDAAAGDGGAKPRPHAQAFNQNSPNMADSAEAGDHFGWALATGDFNHDDFGDLAVGIPDEDLGGQSDAGAVQILYGSAQGLQGIAGEGFVTNIEATAGVVAFRNRLGASLVALDFKNIGQAQLAIGEPGWLGHGAVVLVQGSLIDPGASIGGFGTFSLYATPGCLMGTSLAAGDFDNDPKDDLAVGGPGCDNPFGPGGTTAVHAGEVDVMYNGDDTVKTQLRQDAGFLDVPESGDRVGTSVAVGDVNGDGIDDVVAGAPGEDLGSTVDAGKVNVAIRQSDLMGFDLAPDITRKSLGGSNHAGARFGAAVAAGQRVGTNWNLLAIGAPGDDVGGVNGAGSVWTVRLNVGHHAWNQDTPGIRDAAESGDAFGSSVSLGNFDAKGGVDLAIGIPKEDLGGIAHVGAVAVLYGAGADTALSTADDDFWTQNSANIPETAQPGDRFGFTTR